MDDFYGVDPITGERFLRVTVTDGVRVSPPVWPYLVGLGAVVLIYALCWPRGST